MHQNLSGSPGPAGVARIPERPQTRPAHLDLQPQRHPHGSRRQGASLHGLRGQGSRFLVSSGQLYPVYTLHTRFIPLFIYSVSNFSFV